MPELPEVETVRRGLEAVLVGATIASVVIDDSRLIQPRAPRDVEAAIAMRRCTGVQRRGKYLLIDFHDGSTLEVHLRMTGSFAVGVNGVPEHARHVRARFTLDDAKVLVYNDPRRFGTFRLGPASEIRARLASVLGPEPFDPAWSAASLRQRLRARRVSIKAALLDQHVVAGLGNIYVDEALFLSRIHPMRPARTIRVYELERLIDAVRERLTTAIEAGGSTLRDYRGVEGADGTMQERFVAYGRQGASCMQCGDIMLGARVAGRGTTWCAGCQPRSGPQRCQ